MAVQVRRITEDEADQVVQLWIEASEESGGRIDQASTERIRGQLRLMATHPGAFCLTAVCDGDLCGFVTGCVHVHPIRPGASGEIEELYVKPGFRRAGIGSTLVGGAVRLLRSQSAGVILALCDLNNSPALAFWRQQQWVEEMTLFKKYD